MAGPFNPNIMPIKATYHFRNRLNKWHVTASRQLTVGDGVKYEITRQLFDDYGDALTFVSIFFGNA